MEEIRNRLTKLETKFELEWKHHNTRAEELQNNINAGFDRIESELKSRPCMIHQDLITTAKSHTDECKQRKVFDRVDANERFVKTAVRLLWVIVVAIIGVLVRVMIK